MIVLRSDECNQTDFDRYPRHILSSRQHDKITSKLSRNLYRKTDVYQKSRKYSDWKTHLSTHQLRLLQPNAHCYEELLQAVFSTIHESALAKPAMLDFLLQLYADNNNLIDIRNFAENYHVEDSIYWYTKESFVYRCVNQTLRFGDVDKSYSLRFYTADLSAQLQTLKEEQQKVMEKVGMTVLYRGIWQSDEELNILLGLIGHVVAIKSFMSTSRNKDIALTYASPSDQQSEDSRPLLMEIHVDLSSPAVIAADITRMSNFDEECEVLFNIGSIFRLEMLTFDTSEGIWMCRLTATNEPLTCIQELQTMPFNISLDRLISYGSSIVRSEEVRRHEPNEITNKSMKSLSNDRQKLSWLGYTLIDWAYILHISCFIQWQQANVNKLLDTCERAIAIYAQVDIKDSSDDLQVASSMNDVGYINQLSGKHTTQLIDLFQGSLNIRERYLPSDHILLAQTYRNLGLAYANLGDYHNAFKYHERALNINQHACIAAQWSTVTTLRNMGHLCRRASNSSGAIEYYSKAIDTYYKCLSFFYPTKS